MATLNLVPRASGEGEIGLSNRKWSQAHFTTGNFDNLNIGGNSLNENVDDRVNALLVAGSGITKTYDDAAGTLTLTASGGSASNSFSTISVSGQSNVVADSATDTLTLVAGSNITLTTNASNDSITIASSASGGSSTLGGLSDVTYQTHASGQILINQASSSANYRNQTMSGDATIASNGALTLINSGVSAATYGSASAIPALVIDAKGRVTSASTNALEIVNDATPQLGGPLDVNSQNIISTSNGNISLLPHGTGVVRIAGTDTTGVDIKSGEISIKNSGSVSNVKFYCEASSSPHYTQLQSAAHSAYSGNVTLTLPTTNGTLATTAYVDGVAQGLDVKDSVHVASTGNIATLSDGCDAGATIDGVVLVAGDRVLLKDQNTASENGIYIVGDDGAAPSRASDMAASSNAAGVFVFVEEGAINADNGFVCISNAGSDTVGSDSLAFSQFSGAGQITAGTALAKSGNTLNVAVDGSSIEVNSSDELQIKASGVTSGMLHPGTSSTNDVILGQSTTLSSANNNDLLLISDSTQHSGGSSLKKITVSNLLANTGSSSLSGLSDTSVSSPGGGHILVWQSSNSWANKPLGGDASLAVNGDLTIASNRITSTKLRNDATNDNVIEGLTELSATPATGDFLMIADVDQSSSRLRKITVGNLVAAASGGGGSRPSVHIREDSTETSVALTTISAIQSTDLEKIYVMNNTNATTVTLPALTSTHAYEGLKIQIKRIQSTNVTIDAGSGYYIDNPGSSSDQTKVLDIQYSSLTLVAPPAGSNNVNKTWYII